MFRSKILSLVRNVLNELKRESTLSTNLQCKYMLCTDVAVEKRVEDKGVPDKLYKKIELEIKGNDPAVLKSYTEFVAMAANHLDLTIGRNIALRVPHHDRWTVLKASHVYKKHRVQYEIRTYFRYMDLLRLTESTADTILEYIQRNLPEGVAMKVTKVEIRKLPESVSGTSS